MRVSGRTKVLGILGHPVTHSASPKMQNGVLMHLGLEYVYVPFEVPPDQLDHAVQGLRSLGVAGVNVTIPHKEAILPFLDQVDPAAQAIGAVNTVVNQDGRMVGYNTDGDGFLMDLTHNGDCDPAGRSVVILGAGGSARAIGYSVLKAGVRSLCLLNRTVSRAQELADHLAQYSDIPIQVLPLGSTEGFDALASADLVVNTTSIGLGSPADCPVSEFDWVTEGLVCYDIIYTPLQTRLLKEVEAKGGRSLNGSGMLIGQGVLALEKFTGQSVPFQVMADYF